MNKDYYKILQVSQTSSEEEIGKAYKRLAKLYHPDNTKGDKEAELKFKEVGEAYAVLGDFQKRKQYDMLINNSMSLETSDVIFEPLFKSDIDRYNEKREEYIKFLDEMEPLFNKYNKTLKKEREIVANSKWSLFNSLLDNLYYKKETLRETLNTYETRAIAFDDFQDFYKKIEVELQTLYSRKLINFDIYLDPKNRVSFDREVFFNKIREINKIIFKLKIKREEELKECKEKLERRNLNYVDYFALRNNTEETISLFSIEKILESLKLMDLIDEKLFQFGITVEEFFGLKGKHLIDLKNKELLATYEAIQNYINKIKDASEFDINMINFEESDNISSTFKK